MQSLSGYLKNSTFKNWFGIMSVEDLFDAAFEGACGLDPLWVGWPDALPPCGFIIVQFG